MLNKFEVFVTSIIYLIDPVTKRLRRVIYTTTLDSTTARTGALWNRTADEIFRIRESGNFSDRIPVHRRPLGSARVPRPSSRAVLPDPAGPRRAVTCEAQAVRLKRESAATLYPCRCRLPLPGPGCGCGVRATGRCTVHGDPHNAPPAAAPTGRHRGRRADTCRRATTARAPPPAPRPDLRPGRPAAPLSHLHLATRDTVISTHNRHPHETRGRYR